MPSATKRRSASAHEREVLRYCEDVLSGKIVAGQLVHASVRRFLADMETGRERGLYFDYADANRTIDFVQLLKHSTGEFDGQLFILRPWQKFIFWSLFGWKREATRKRRFRDAFLSMGRGNGKSPMAAAILNRLCFLESEARAQLKCAAVERDQARAVFDEAAAQIKSSEFLRKKCDFWKNSLVFRSLGSSIVPLGGEGKSKDGFNLHGFVADEIHAWTEEHKELWSKLETAMGKRKQPLAIVITTAGSDRSTLWIRIYTHSVQVVTGVFPDDAHFSMIYEVDSDDVRDEKGRILSDFSEECFQKANPNLDISVQRDFLLRFSARAAVDPVAKADFLRYHLNTRVRDAQKVISPAMWLKGCGPLPDLGRLAGHSGLDLGWRDDLASFYECFALPNHRFALRGWSWIPAHGRRELSAPPWSDWIADWHIVATPGSATDVDSIEAFVLGECAAGRVKSVAADPSNARASLQHFQPKVKTFEFDQTARNYNEAVREFLKALSEGRILHGDDPVLAWAADNLVLRTNSAGLVMPDKQKADEKIDPIVAAIMAFAGCLYQSQDAVQPRVRSL